MRSIVAGVTPGIELKIRVAAGHITLRDRSLSVRSFGVPDATLERPTSFKEMIAENP
jgi:hypothetical protein